MKQTNIKRLLVLIAAFLLSLAGISFYGGPVTYGFFTVVVTIPPVLLLYILCVIASLKIYQQPDGRNMVSGSPSDFYITLQNEGWFSFSSLRILFYSSFSTIIGLEDDIVYELPPHSSIKRKTQLLCRYRGEYKVGIKKIIVQDFLGIFSVTYPIREPLTVIVAPAVIRPEELRIAKQDPDADRDRLRDPIRPDIPVREYVAGDDIRFLNWKASAVMQKPMVRERIGEEKNKIALLMEPKRYGSMTEQYLPPENKVIECVLALSLYYLENGIPVDVIYRTDKNNCQSIESVKDFEDLYSIMCGYTFREDRDSGRMLAEAAGSGVFSEYRQVLLIMQKWSSQNEEYVKQGNIGRVPCQILLIGKETDPLIGNSENDPNACSIIRIDNEDPLEDVL